MPKIEDEILEKFFQELEKTDGFSKAEGDGLRQGNVRPVEGTAPMIKIESITIKELRGIRDLTLTLNNEPFVISGPNGPASSVMPPRSLSGRS